MSRSLKLRNISDYHLKKLEDLANEQGISRDKMCSNILENFADGIEISEEYKSFFRKETEGIISTLNKNSDYINRVLKILENGGLNGNQD